MRRIMLLAAAVALVFGFGFTACGDDDDDGGDAEPSKSALVDTLTKDNLFTEPQASCVADEVFDGGFSDDELNTLIENPTGDMPDDMQAKLTTIVQGCIDS